MQHEPLLEGCEKIFILNRIVDPNEEQAIVKLLCDYQQAYLRIPFSWDDYKKAEWNILDYPISYAPYKLKDLKLRQDLAVQAELSLYRHKNNYVMNNNGARNLALQDGRSKADWILPWDGNCFVSQAAWRAIKQQVLNNIAYPYHVIPMARLLDNQSILCTDFEPEPTEEPQILFRSDSTEKFDSRFCYGRRPKVELLWRLGVPGKWDDWAIFPWDLPCPDYSKDAGHYTQGAWVARLFSGKPHLERKDQQSSRERGETRSEAILTMLDQLDDSSYSNNTSTTTSLLTRVTCTSHCDGSNLALLKEATKRAAGKKHQIESYSVNQLLQDLVIGSLAQCHSARSEFCQLIGNNLNKLFPDTQEKECSKRLKVADPSLLTLFLFTIKTLKQRQDPGTINTERLDIHLEDHLNWLIKSHPGQIMRSKSTYIGTQYDLLVSAISLYFGQTQTAKKTFRDSRFRILEQFDTSNEKHLTRRTKNNLHHECLNLQLWIYLAELAKTIDEDLWNFTARNGNGIQQAIRRFLKKFENYKTFSKFDKQRLLPISDAYRQQYVEPFNLPSRFKTGPISQCKPVFPIETGIFPFWNLGAGTIPNHPKTSKKLTPEYQE
ncbi:alginate lyase family protein [Microbulbifer sp. A4B17]|uniref:alginate lyase family protein n=1 Tax=Microbulbifer sp. A4B17 TaxID=359370 RepID=UPI001EDDAC46|nr:alginate lyase family protein [Microbulbifer sp. A4B17]